MDSPYHRRPPSSAEDDSDDDERNPFHNPTLDLNASSDRIPLTQDISNVPFRTPSPLPQYRERSSSRYALSQTYVPQVQSPRSGLGVQFAPNPLPFSGARSRPTSSHSNGTDDWIQRQQPVQATQADLRRYQTRRVKLTQGSVFSADYPYSQSRHGPEV
jgi:chitin synthase